MPQPPGGGTSSSCRRSAFPHNWGGGQGIGLWLWEAAIDSGQQPHRPPGCGAFSLLRSPKCGEKKDLKLSGSHILIPGPRQIQPSLGKGTCGCPALASKEDIAETKSEGSVVLV